MDKNKNYYEILGISKEATEKEIKKSYYKLSFKLHPDKNKDVDISLFNEINEAYNVLCSDLRSDYDMKSKWGKNYNEYFELFDIEFDVEYDDIKKKLENFKKNEVNNIQIKIDDTFSGTIEYERWVKCKSCDGIGKDLSSKIVIKDKDGNVTKIFDADDGCDFCFECQNEVITKEGPVRISDIKLGDYVLSSNNEYYEVIKLMNRQYTGYVYDVDVCGIKIEGATPNHKINVVRFDRNKQERIKIDNYSLLEIPIEDLKTDDFILYQKQSYNNFNKHIKLDNTINRESINIPIDDDFIKFIACYITEGNTRGDRVVITMHLEKDNELINFIKDYVSNKLNSNVKTFQNIAWGDKTLKIEISNSQLAKFLKKFCGHTSLNKFINHDIMGKFDQLLLDTLLACDGYKKNNLRTYTSISKKLANQVLHIALGLGHNASISKYNGYIDKNGTNHRDCYRVYITYSDDMNKMGHYIKKIKEGICLKVKNINKRYVSDIKVYNITVNETHKYTINGLLVNNCEGLGKDYVGNDCQFCGGKGKVGLNKCNTCKGERRILGRQKINKVKLTGEKTLIESMGHFSRDGKVGYLLLVK
jgi:hypothetical protein